MNKYFIANHKHKDGHISWIVCLKLPDGQLKIKNHVETYKVAKQLLLNYRVNNVY